MAHEEGNVSSFSEFSYQRSCGTFSFIVLLPKFSISVAFDLSRAKAGTGFGSLFFNEDSVRVTAFLQQFDADAVFFIMKRILFTDIKGSALKMREFRVSIDEFHRCLSTAAFRDTVICIHNQ